MTGTLIYLMGPSGAGKDSLLDYARAHLPMSRANNWQTPEDRRTRKVVFVRRHITRPAAAWGERHCPLSPEAFQQRLCRGEFALHWESHGLRYGISREIDTRLAEGAVVLVNGSRAYLSEALFLYPDLLPILVFVRPDALRSRLEWRGRENAASIDERLAGAAMPLPDISGLVVLDNSGPLEEAGNRLLSLVNRLRQQSPFLRKSHTKDTESSPMPPILSAYTATFRRQA
jgi:ribose 1,5-bisphosphokinase